MVAVGTHEDTRGHTSVMFLVSCYVIGFLATTFWGNLLEPLNFGGARDCGSLS